MRKTTKGVLVAKYATETMMVIYPLLGGLIRLDVNPNGGFSAGVMLGSFGDDAIFFLFFPLLSTSPPYFLSLFFYSGSYSDGWI